jgi:hypothetical protein
MINKRPRNRGMKPDLITTPKGSSQNPKKIAFTLLTLLLSSRKVTTAS